MYMRFCDLCRLETRVDVLERVEVFPLGLVCPACAVEIREDEAHPRDAELEDECADDACDCCRGAGCRLCLAVPGWLG